jgi:hypothetical protein
MKLYVLLVSLCLNSAFIATNAFSADPVKPAKVTKAKKAKQAPVKPVEAPTQEQPAAAPTQAAPTQGEAKTQKSQSAGPMNSSSKMPVNFVAHPSAFAELYTDTPASLMRVERTNLMGVYLMG